MSTAQPHRIHVGSGLVLVSLDGIALDWGITEDSVRKIVGHLKLPTLKWPNSEKRYINLWALEYALFEMTLSQPMRGDRDLVRLVHETASVVYGTLRQEVIRDRVRKLAQEMRKGTRALTSLSKGPKIGRRTP